MAIRSLKNGTFSRSLLVGNTAYDPAPVAGYTVWLDAANASSFTYSSGTSVSQWLDRSTNGYAFTQATATNQPSRSTTLNGKSTVLFDASNDQLISTAAASTWSFLHNGDGATVFAVLKSTRVAGAISCYLITSNLDSSTVGQNDFFTDNKFYADTLRGTSGQEIAATVAHTISSWNVFSYYLDQDNATVGDKIRLYKDDGAVNNSTGNYSGSNNNPYRTLTLGGISPYLYGGEIAEIIIYSSILSNADREANVDYLQAKWGL